MKKYLISLIAICILMTGCQSKAVVKPLEAVETNQLVSEDKDDNSKELEYEPWTLENLLFEEAETLTQKQKETIQAIIDKINDLEATDLEENYDALDVLYLELTTTLEEFGIETYFEDDEDYSSEMDQGDYDFEPWTLESYLGFEYSKLTEEQLIKAQEILDRINKAEEDYTEDNAESVRDIYNEMKELLKSFGLKVPVSSMEEFVLEYPDSFTKDEKEELIKLDEKIIELSQEDPDSNGIEFLYEKLEKILTDAGFDSDEVLTQMESGSVIYAKFQLKDADIAYIGDKTGATPGDIEKFNYLVDRTLKVVSEDMKPYVEHILINSDGKDNVLAYVRQENDELTKWRIVLDINDAFDAKGDYINEYDETIVHEFAHLLTLNASQMQKNSSNTYENEEGILTEDAYLNQFYQKFWLDIQGDFDEIVDAYDPDTVYDFYDKYEDHFVTDYAATNPEEDIAESFRLFVCFDKPQGDEIKDEKVKWFYQFEELVELRERIRENLQL